LFFYKTVVDQDWALCQKDQLPASGQDDIPKARQRSPCCTTERW